MTPRPTGRRAANIQRSDVYCPLLQPQRLHLLLIHQNFPGQFRDLAPAWLQRGHRITAVGSTPLPPAWVQPIQDLGTFWFARYTTVGCDNAGLALEQKLRQLIKQHGLRPDLVIAHSGWGEALPVKRLWPQTPLVVYPELWGSARALGEGYDPLQPPLTPHQRLLVRHQNRLAARALTQADAAVVPTRFQRDSFPQRWRQGIAVIHEGVDCQRLQANAAANLCLTDGTVLTRQQQVISYVSRAFEPLRGLHTFLAALPPLLRRNPQLQVVMAGGSGTPYSLPGHQRGPLDQQLEQLPQDFDLSRLHRLGAMTLDQLSALSQISRAHTYLTYPYALSWSVLEAMACEAPVVGNGDGPLDDLIEPEHNGLLVDFNSPEQLTASIDRLLNSETLQQRLGQAARQTVMQHYNLKTAVERYELLLLQLVAQCQSASQRSRRANTS